MRAGSLLIVDNDSALASTVTRAARDRGFQPVTVTSLEETETALSTFTFDAALVDLELGSAEGFGAIRRLKAIAPAHGHLIDIRPGVFCLIATYCYKST